uniref:4Fe-4S ferredoxin-type domain-containing protein n=1 Tax=Ciona savignyi TaxID=51511 RepID=H2YWV5_CIOSA
MQDNLLPEIRDSVCARALAQQMGAHTKAEVYDSMDCLDCQIAEPVCWNSCPMMVE